MTTVTVETSEIRAIVGDSGVDVWVGHFTTDQLDAINAADAPSAANQFVTVSALGDLAGEAGATSIEVAAARSGAQVYDETGPITPASLQSTVNIISTNRHYPQLTAGTGVAAGVRADNTDALEAAIAGAISDGRGEIVLPAGDFEADAISVTLTSDNIAIVGAGSGRTRIRFPSPAAGSQVQLTGNSTSTPTASTTLAAAASPGDGYLQVADASSFAAGDWIVIQDTTDSGGLGNWPYDARAGQYNGEWAEVESIDTSTTPDRIYLVGSVQSSQEYPITATTVKSYAFRDHARVEGLTLEIATAASGKGLMSVSFLNQFQFNDIALIRGASAGLGINYSLNGLVDSATIWGGAELTATTTGYGVVTTSSQYLLMRALNIYAQRRCVDLSGAWPSRNVTIADSIMRGNDGTADSTGIGTHGPAEDCTFTGNQLVGFPDGAVYIRGNRISVLNNQFYGNHTAAIIIADGARHEAIGNVVHGMQHYTTGAGSVGRWTQEYVRYQSENGTLFISRGNVTHVNNTHIHASGTDVTPEIWINDDIEFRGSGTGLPTQDVLLVDGSASVTYSIECRSINHDNIVRTDSGTATPVNRLTKAPNEARHWLPATVFYPAASVVLASSPATAQAPAHPFANGSDTYIHTTYVLPGDYNGEDITARLLWTTNAAAPAGNIAWFLYTAGVASTEDIDVAATYTNSVAVAMPAQFVVSATTIGTIPGSGLAAGDILRIAIRRNGADASDTSTDDARMIGLRLTYDKSAAY